MRKPTPSPRLLAAITACIVLIGLACGCSPAPELYITQAWIEGEALHLEYHLFSWGGKFRFYLITDGPESIPIGFKDQREYELHIEHESGHPPFPLSEQEPIANNGSFKFEIPLENLPELSKESEYLLAVLRICEDCDTCHRVYEYIEISDVLLHGKHYRRPDFKIFLMELGVGGWLFVVLIFPCPLIATLIIFLGWLIKRRLQRKREQALQ